MVKKDDVYKSHVVSVCTGEPANSVSRPPAKRKAGVVRPITTGKLLRPGGPSQTSNVRSFSPSWFSHLLTRPTNAEAQAHRTGDPQVPTSPLWQRRRRSRKPRCSRRSGRTHGSCGASRCRRSSCTSAAFSRCRRAAPSAARARSRKVQGVSLVFSRSSRVEG